ncbi:MAG: cytochrome c biogenesis protein CcsA [Sediminispirochaetaceae bacterium]
MFASTAFVILIVLIVTQTVKFFRRSHGSYEVEQVFFLMSAFLLLADFAYRSYTIGYPAVTNTYESLVFFTAVICILQYLIARRIGTPDAHEGEGRDWIHGHRLILFIGTIIGFLLLALASSPLVPSSVQPPVPALQSYWLIFHVLLSFIGEAFFVVGFAAAVVFLAAGSERVRLEADRIAYTSILIGYFLFTVGALVFGMIWAEQAWGSYWSWDPKETWALVTWLAYTLYLHLRIIMGKKGRVTAVVAIAGLLCAMFTFFGVNYLVGGLHSYV